MWKNIEFDCHASLAAAHNTHTTSDGKDWRAQWPGGHPMEPEGGVLANERLLVEDVGEGEGGSK